MRTPCTCHPRALGTVDPKAQPHEGASRAKCVDVNHQITHHQKSLDHRNMHTTLRQAWHHIPLSRHLFSQCVCHTEAMAHGFIALIASCLTVGLFTSPLKIAQEIRLNKATGAYSAIPYLAMALNCFFWSLYGYNLGDNAIIVPNAIGIFVACLTLSTFKNNVEQDRQAAVTRQYQIGAAIGAVLLSWAYLIPPYGNSKGRLGLLGAALSISMFASPLATIRQVVTEKNSASLPIPMVIMGTLATIFWSLYGHAIGDMFILVPNVLGLTFSLLQLGLAGIYPRRAVTLARPTSIATL